MQFLNKIYGRVNLLSKLVKSCFGHVTLVFYRNMSVIKSALVFSNIFAHYTASMADSFEYIG